MVDSFLHHNIQGELGDTRKVSARISVNFFLKFGRLTSLILVNSSLN